MLFNPGRVCITHGVNALFDMEFKKIFLAEIVRRHVSGDWGTAGQYEKILKSFTSQELQSMMNKNFYPEEDGKINIVAIRSREGTVRSYYPQDAVLPGGNPDSRVWVVTEFDHEDGPLTTILLPEEH